MPWGITPSVINETKGVAIAPAQANAGRRNLSRRPLYHHIANKLHTGRCEDTGILGAGGINSSGRANSQCGARRRCIPEKRPLMTTLVYRTVT